MKLFFASPFIIPLFIRLVLVLILCQLITQCGAAPWNQIPVKTTSQLITAVSKSAISANTIKYKGRYDSIPVAHLSEARQRWLQLLESKAQRWQAQNITSYEIKVSYQKGFWNPDEVYTYTVKNGEVVQWTFEARECGDSKCNKGATKSGENHPTYFGGNTLTIVGLFEVVRSLLKDGYWNDDVTYNIVFDPEFGYPSSINQNSVRASDVAVDWDVVYFKVI